MKQRSKRCGSLLLALLLVFLSAAPAFGMNSAYPADVAEPTAKAAARRTDPLIQNAFKAFTGTTVSANVYKLLFGDETLSGMLTGIYEMTDERSNVLSTLGLDLTPSALAVHLKGYPSVAARLKNAESWGDVDLDGAHWHVSNKTEFAVATSAILSPLNNLLYMLLCGGSLRAGLLTIRGDLGYEKGIVPMLRALGCPTILSPASFYAQAAKNRGSMIRQIVLSLLSLVDAVCAAPVAKLTATLPGLAIFVRDGDFEKAVDKLLRPLSLHIGSYIDLFTGSQMLGVLLFLQDPSRGTVDFKTNLTQSINGMLESSGIRMAEIDLDALAACKGKLTDCFMVLFRWILATLRLNTAELDELLGDTEPLDALASGLFRHSDEWLISTFVHLLTDAEGTIVEVRPQERPFTRGSVDFPHKLGRSQMKRVLGGIDKVLGEFTADSTGDDLTTTLRGYLYSGDTVTALARGLYGAFAGEESSGLGTLLGLPATPAALASRLPSRFSAARRTLSRVRSWEALKTVPWSFANGNRSGFAAAVTAVLQPMRPLLEAFFANGIFELLGAVRLGGTNGYNTAILPLLEALSCPTTHLKTYDEYIAGKGTDRILTDVLTPVLDLADMILESPVAMLAKLLPNFVFFVESGALSAGLDAILTPVTILLDSFGLSAADFGLGPLLEGNIKFGDLLYDLTQSIDEAALLDDIDWPLIASLGKQTSEESKRTYHGKPVSADYIKSDRSAVLLTLLRGIITAVKRPENADLMTSMVAQTGGDNTMFAQYTAKVSAQMDQMTTDELLVWLYQLLFRERARKIIKNDDYVPDFSYEPEPSHTLRNVLLVLGALLLIAAAIVVWWRRREISAWFNRRKAAKAAASDNKEA